MEEEELEKALKDVDNKGVEVLTDAHSQIASSMSKFSIHTCTCT